MTNYPCGNSHIIYKNETTTLKTARVSVTESCGGHCQIVVIDINGDPVKDALLDSPGGVVDMDVAPGNRLRVFCDTGDSSMHNCKVDLTVI